MLSGFQRRRVYQELKMRNMYINMCEEIFEDISHDSMIENLKKIYSEPQKFGGDLFLLFKYYMKDVKQGVGKIPLFNVKIPRKAELSEINRFDLDMLSLGFRKTQTCYLSSSSLPFEYEVWGRAESTTISFTLDRNPF